MKWEADLADAPPVVAEIFTRECIQSSVDPFRTRKRLLAKLGIDPVIEKFGINFGFAERVHLFD